MSVTTLEGVVKNGHIVLPDDAILPESAKVYVLFADEEARIPRVWSAKLVNKEDAKLFEKVVEVVADDEI